MIEICLDESILLLAGRVSARMAGVRDDGVMVVIHPLDKVVGELEAAHIGCSILEVNDNELLVLVGWL